MAPEIAVRSARVNDAPFLARIALIAARAHIGSGFYDVWFGGTDAEHLRRLERAALTKDRWLHHWSMRLVAEDDGAAAGSISGFPASAAYFSMFPAAMQEMLTSAETASFEKNRVATDTCTIAHPEGAWGIELVGVLPEFRGRGVADRMLEAILDRGREQGFTTSSIIFEIDNYPAQRVYERAGFVLIEEKRHPEFERVMRTPGLRRVERAL
jgi:ribosomal protein S18 acetylase RimI-like enzyme